MAAVPDPPAEQVVVVPSRRGAGRNLPAAIAVGVALAALFLGSLAVGPYAFLAFVAAVLVVAQLELDSAFRARATRPAVPVAIGAGLVMLFGTYASGEPALVGGVVILALGAPVWVVLDRNRQHAAARIGATYLIGLWVPFLASFISLLLRAGEGRTEGQALVIAVVGLAVANDVGAYAFGSRLGRHKMAPDVSPGKSWEGLVGGLVTALVVAASAVTRLVPALEVSGAVALGVGIVVAATFGDLCESLVKRDLGIKDLGRILPGHGGVMDRIDAMLFALPAAYFLLVALGR